MIELRVYGEVTVEKELDRVSRAVTDFESTGIWDGIISDVLVPEIKDVYVSDGNGTWAPRLDNLDHPLLRKTRTMYKSDTIAGAQGNINRQSPNEMEWGSDLYYRDFQEGGTSRMVARPVYGLVISNDFDNKVEKYVDNKIQSFIGG